MALEVVNVEPMVVVQPAIQELQLEGQAALSVQDQLGRRSQLSRLSPNSKRPPGSDATGTLLVGACSLSKSIFWV